jgi:hypothetical protein
MYIYEYYYVKLNHEFEIFNIVIICIFQIVPAGLS